MKTIKISKDFTKTPGARYISDGPFSGQAFRETFLEDFFKNPDKNEHMHIYLDGTSGYPTSFLEEAFGGLARLYGAKNVLESISFISQDDTFLPEEITRYINATEEK